MYSNEDKPCIKCGKTLGMTRTFEEFDCDCLDESSMRPPALRETQVEKPYINLNEDFPGIVSLFMYDKETAKNLTAMGQTIMRRERPYGLSVGERELIASFVSKMNECKFCYQSHMACTEGFLDPEVVRRFLVEEDSEVLSMKMRTLMVVALHVQSLNREELPKAIMDAKSFGATDEEVHDTVLVASFFSMCNRYVDGLGTTFKRGEPEQGGAGLVTYGYTMGVRRFVREVLPKLWSKFWG